MPKVPGIALRRVLGAMLCVAAGWVVTRVEASTPLVERAVSQADSLCAGKPPAGSARSLCTASAYDSLGIALFFEGSEAAVAAAETLLGRSVALRERHQPDSLPLAASLDALASLRFNHADYEAALPLRERCLEIRIARLGAKDPVVARTQHELGANLAALGRYVEAQPHLEAARTTLERMTPRDQASFIDLLTTVGEFRRIENRYVEAESSLVQAVRLARDSLPPDDPYLFFPINNLGGVYKDQGRFDEAEILLRESLDICRKAPEPDPTTLADAHLNLAELTRLQGRMAESESLYARALEYARQGLGPENPRMAWYLNQSAVLQRDLGRWNAAERLSQEARAVLEKADDEPLLAQTLVDLAELLVLQDRRREAETYAKRAVALREKALGRDHPETAMALVVQARSRSAKKDAVADALLDRAVRILDAAPAYLEARVDAHASRANRRAARGDRRGAIDDLGAALATVDVLRPRRGGEDVRAGFVGSYARLYEDRTRLCLETGDIATAFETVERSRARVFLDQLAAAHVDLGARVPAATRAPLEERARAARLQLRAIQDQLQAVAAESGADRAERFEALTRERDRYAVELQRAEEELRRASPEWREVATEAGRPVSLDDAAREIAPPGGLLLVYALGEAASWVFAVPDTVGRAHAWPLVLDAPSAAALGLKPGPFRAGDVANAIAALDLGRSPRAVVQRGIGSVRPRDASAVPRDLDGSLHALWLSLVPAPLRARLRAAPTIVAVPDGALHTLPLEALVVEKPAAGAARDWLDAGPAVRYAASATSLAQLEARARRPATGNAVLSLAAPEFAATGRNRSSALVGRDLPALPSTTREAEAVRAAFAPRPVEILSGASATEARLRAELPKRRFVHLATHGVVDRQRNALLAGLALTPGKARATLADDGFLQLFEIYDLQLDADLTVLSACETSAGAFVAGEGVFALSRGFLTAGSRRVVASLWQVEDVSTAALVGGLFERLATAERTQASVDPVLALRDAKRALRARSEWSHPFYWAPFVLTGAR